MAQSYQGFEPVTSLEANHCITVPPSAPKSPVKMNLRLLGVAAQQVSGCWLDEEQVHWVIGAGEQQPEVTPSRRHTLPGVKVKSFKVLFEERESPNLSQSGPFGTRWIEFRPRFINETQGHLLPVSFYDDWSLFTSTSL
ncbi:unnamed protein product [Pleuronectes platessa]|uniref:Uncharacterized protein n=1 Tax=Pleuronectes platessa TaxID=8262 RepID=A0A9N7UF85_PLEPL|nr:unnamed protein product [Pleuronectes platessa]